jgi:biopolymer transport protein ExbD
MEMNMAADDMISDSDRFVMLDLADSISENQTNRDYPIVQIVDSSNKYSLQNVEAIKSRLESKIKFEEKREDLFTISLNMDEDYKNQLFR